MVEQKQSSRELWLLTALVFVQMLPATLVAPAIRPLFASLHGGQEGPMHAFMSVNMIGAAIAAPLAARYALRLSSTKWLIAALALLDGVLLFAVAMPWSTSTILVLRTIEGGAHVSTATLLLIRASVLGKKIGHGKAMGMAGGAVMFAVATGSALGGALLLGATTAPFQVGGVLSIVVALVVFGSSATRFAVERVERVKGRLPRSLWPSVSLAFVARFTVGCLVVTFALFAHRTHNLEDSTIGLLFALLTYPFAIATYPAARIGSRIPRACLMGGSVALYALSLGVIGFVPAGWLPLTMLVAGFASAGIFASILCYASELSGPQSRGKTMAWVNAAGSLGMVLGPMVAGITSAVLQRSHDASFAHRTVFLVAAGSLVAWLVLSLRHLAARARIEHVEAHPSPSASPHNAV